MTKELQICSYREFLYNYLFKKFPRARREDVEDAVQNTLVKAVRFADKWQGGSTLKTWLTVIAVNMYLDTFRKTYSKNEYLLGSSEDMFVFDKISTEDFSETLCENNYLTVLVEELLSGFEDNVHVQAFNLNIVDDIDYKDIAIQQNIPIGTVKSRVFRAKKLLQEKYRAIIHKYEETTV
jgi:RNA polymerase sigma-70 factor (ECF subfamily)